MFITALKKEARMLFSDHGFLLIALIQPIVFIVMFGSSFQGGDINYLETIIVDQDKTPFSEYVIQVTEQSEYFEVVSYMENLNEAKKLLEKSKVRAIIHIPPGFSKSIESAQSTDLNIYLDSTDFLVYSSLRSAQIEIIKESLTKVTNDIVKELEDEKDSGKTKLNNIKEIFSQIENFSKDLKSTLNHIRFDSQEQEKQMLSKLNSLETNLNNQLKKLNETIYLYETLINTANNIQTENIEELLTIINTLEEMKNQTTNSRSQIKNLLNNLNNINTSLDSNDILYSVENKINKIQSLFDSADIISEDIDLDFNKLEKQFLSEPIILNEYTSHGPIEYFDYLGPGVLSLIVFFVGVMAPVLNIISEKEKNTLYRLVSTPVSGFSIFLGKFFLFIIFGFIEMLYTLFLAIILYNLRIEGSIINVVIILFLLSCAATSIGLFISSIIKTMQQGLIVVPLVVIPSFLISNSFFPPDIMPDFMNYVSLITPMTYSNNALRNIMTKGLDLTSSLSEIFILFLFILIPLILFIINYKRIKY